MSDEENPWDKVPPEIKEALLDRSGRLIREWEPEDELDGDILVEPDPKRTSPFDGTDLLYIAILAALVLPMPFVLVTTLQHVLWTSVTYVLIGRLALRGFSNRLERKSDRPTTLSSFLRELDRNGIPWRQIFEPRDDIDSSGEGWQRISPFLLMMDPE